MSIWNAIMLGLAAGILGSLALIVFLTYVVY